MVKSATFRSKESFQSKILYELTPLTEKLTVEADYLPCIILMARSVRFGTAMPNK